MSGRRLAVRSTDDLGPLFAENPHAMVGQDGAYSIPLSASGVKGPSLWFFGDTLIGSRRPGRSLWYEGAPGEGEISMSGRGDIRRVVNNTGLILEDVDGSSGLRRFSYVTDPDGDLLQLVPHDPDEDPESIRVWCLDGIALAGTVYLFYVVIRLLPGRPVPANFEIVGSGVASSGDPGRAFRRAAGERGTLFWKAGLPNYGSAVLKQSPDRHVYVYGARNEPDLVQRCYLARVPDDRVTSLSAYQYYAAGGSGPGDSDHGDGRGRWTGDPNQATPVLSGMPNEMSVSYNGYLGCYLAVHSLAGTDRIVASTAADPWGPWSDAVEVYTVTPSTGPTDRFTPLIYAGKEHPELAEENGRVIYLTYIEFEEYYPHLVRVVLE